MTRRTKRRLIGTFVIVSLVVVALFGRPIFYIVRSYWRDRDEIAVLPSGEVDDASRLNRSRVAEVWQVPDDLAAAEEQLRALMQRALAAKIPISIAGARHSMGGHTIAPDGIAVQMLGFRRMDFDAESGILTVGAGALWADVLPFLDAHGQSVAVMQSNDSFSVGGSLSVNCHGWQVGKSPFISTVESFRMMTSDGVVRMCCRTENAELFSLAAGGYGLFGVILDVKLRVVPNARYRVERAIFPAHNYEAEFAQRVEVSPDAEMAFCRLCVVPGERTFLREAILTSFHLERHCAECSPRRRHGPPLCRARHGCLRFSVQPTTRARVRRQAGGRDPRNRRGIPGPRWKLLPPLSAARNPRTVPPGVPQFGPVLRREGPA